MYLPIVKSYYQTPMALFDKQRGIVIASESEAI